MQGRYYAKLGILTTINDEDEEEEEKDKGTTMKITSRNNSSGDSCFGSTKLSDATSEGDLDKSNTLIARKNTTKIDQRFKEESEKLLKDAKEGNLKKIKEVFGTITKPSNNQELDIKKIKKLIDERGNGGWNSLHFAIFFGYQAVVKEFLNKFDNSKNNRSSKFFIGVQM